MSEVTRCSVCGRLLTAPLSIRRGIGPVCLKKIKTKMEMDSMLSRFKEDEEEQ